MTSKMSKYIDEIPTILRKIVVNKFDIIGSFLSSVEKRKFDQIYIIGSGSSYHAGLGLKGFIEEITGIKVTVMFATHFADKEIIVSKNTLVIGISQGGQSLSTYNGLNYARKNGLYTMALSENPNALINEKCDSVVRIEVDNELACAKTKGYQGTIITLMLMFLEYSKKISTITEDKYDYYMQCIDSSINNIAPLIEKSKEWYKNNKAELINCKRLIIVGYDEQYGNVLEGALKILETVRIGVTGYDVEEFYHGIYNAIDEECYMIYLTSLGAYKDRIETLHSLLSEWTDKNYVFGDLNEKFSKDRRNLNFEFTDDKHISVLEYVVPMQVISSYLGYDKGIDVDIPKSKTFHGLVGSKILDGVRDFYKE